MMFIVVFLKLLLAHLAAGFLLLPGYATARARSGTAISTQALIKLGIACVLLLDALAIDGLVALIMLAACGMIVDVLERRVSYTDWHGFAAAQATHVALLLAIALWWVGYDVAGVWRTLLDVLDDGDKLLYVTVYVGAVAGGDAIVQKVTAIFAEQIPTLQSAKPGLQHAGRYIGWLERALIVSFMVAGYGEAIGFLVATKALARFPKLQGDDRGQFTDYFLVGTLTSVGVALLGGIVLRMAGLTLPSPK
jgi:hypothetical protein